MEKKKYSRFESQLKVRPDDIDMNNHVHSSKYMDYVFAARYEQMETGYKMPMEDFLKLNYTWIVSKACLEFKRPLILNDTITIKTWIEELRIKDLTVGFEIIINKSKKQSCTGSFNFTLVNLETKTSEIIPNWIIDHYSI